MVLICSQDLIERNHESNNNFNFDKDDDETELMHKYYDISMTGFLSVVLRLGGACLFYF